MPTFYNPNAPIQKTEHRLPHWQQNQVPYFVTWRLADSLPQNELALLKAEKEEWIKNHPDPWDAKTKLEYHKKFFRRVDQWLDAGAGSCVLKQPLMAKIAADSLLFFNGERYDMESFVVMPNHVHALFSLKAEFKLEKILHTWKTHVALEINKRLGKRGRFWQREYWDRMIRGSKGYCYTLDYIRNNPLKAKLRTDEFLFWSRWD